jgi:hypothetical protein
MTDKVKVVIRNLIKSSEDKPVYHISSIGVVHVDPVDLIATKSAQRQLVALDKLSKLEAPMKTIRK